MCRDHGVATVTDAVRMTLRHEETSLGLVRFFLRETIEQKTEPSVTIDYPGPEVRQGSTADYAELMPTAEACHD